ncbi:hypothetical protein POVWA1_026750 [Plasmodium ovale wallikeri]|uniref:Uncharacterized protein n=1 Tax=Plasmodium ovale wallikeri TaxID=864142 RepID=A0A1A8YUU6_PLAOA|nr:hypothetical protein POVWA1_026750 [Plasmodium ovale wallikeri]
MSKFGHLCRDCECLPHAKSGWKLLIHFYFFFFFSHMKMSPFFFINVATMAKELFSFGEDPQATLMFPLQLSLNSGYPAPYGNFEGVWIDGSKPEEMQKKKKKKKKKKKFFVGRISDIS